MELRKQLRRNPLIASRGGRQEIYSYEALHTTQAMDMRMQDGKKMGEGTTKFLKAYRKSVPFVSKDHIYTPDINNGIKFLRTLDPATLK